jgi:hypothetical protein
MNCLILFSGTKSFSKTMLRMNKECDKTIYKDIRTLDLNPHFNPTICENILEWNYKEYLKDFKVDYLHSSPVCTHFSKLKNHSKRNLKLGYSLFDKTIEIIEWIKKNNNKYLKFTIENPKSKLTLTYPPLMTYKHKITSYCQYQFLYQKHTTFWYGGFELKLKCQCNIKNICYSKSINNNIHKVRIGVSKNSKTHILGKGQIGDNEYYKELRKKEEYKGFKMSCQFFRFRIPPKLIEDILKSLDEEEIIDNEIIEEIIDLPVEPINYKKMKVVDLKKLCKDRKIKRYSKLKKQELIDILQ